MLGRDAEREVLDRLLDGVRAGRGGALVMHGEPGVGKTALLDYAVEAAPEFQVARIVGVEAEMELPYAAVQQLCSPFLELSERLPQPQHDALDVAFGLRAGPAAPDRFLVGLAVLGLLAEAAGEQPLACGVDDAQWLDSASAQILTFVGRRLVAEKIALVFAIREPVETLSVLPELHVAPLGRRDARALLESVLPAPLDERVVERIVAETRGNPLALLELPRGLSPSQLAGGFGLPPTAPLSTGIEDRYTRRLARLPSDARRLLLVAAADPVGDPALVWRAAERLGIPELAAQIVESEELLTLCPRVVFRHPLVRSAVYRAAVLSDRREVHRALAEAIDPETEPDRRAWHRAQATAAPDEEVAADLARSAARAQARGGVTAAAAFLDRAAALTPDPARRAGRALSAAKAKFQAGALDEALELLEIAESGAAGDDVLRAHAHLLRAQIAFAASRGSDSAPLLLDAARRLSRIDVALGRETYLEALAAAMFAGRLALPGASVVDVASAARAAPRPVGPPRPADVLLDGLTELFTEGFAPAVPILRRAHRAFASDGHSPAEQLRWLWLASASATHIWDDEAALALADRHVCLAREAGALGELPLALTQRVFVHVFAGELRAAEVLVGEIHAAMESIGGALVPYAAAALGAFQGRESTTASLIARGRSDGSQRGEGVGLTVLEWAEAVLDNGLGRHAQARAVALRAIHRPQDIGSSNWGMVELIEAAARSGGTDLALAALRRLVEMTDICGTDWALGIKARSAALLAGAAAEELYLEAIERLQRSRFPIELARAQLLYGEWLRRERRRVDAREQLRIAHDFFRDAGAEAFAERARIELEATGGHARKRTVDTLDELTPQEMQVARHAVLGETNKEIATRLFISESTVEYHLRKVFRKLGVRSRTQLADRLS